MTAAQFEVQITAPQPQPAQALLKAEPGLYVNHENPTTYHLVTSVSAVNSSAKRMIVTIAQDPTDPAKISVVSSQLNYFGRPATAGSMIRIAVPEAEE